MAQGEHKITQQFEYELSHYTGAPYAVAIDNGSNAIFLALKYSMSPGTVVHIPSHTYPSVPCEIIHAGGMLRFYKSSPYLTGAYQLINTEVIDSALHFTCNMYSGGFMCLSFTGPYKHLKLGKGGAILTDNKAAYDWFRRARFSGRRDIDYHNDSFDMIGWNFYMMPEIAARGLQLMRQFYVGGVPVSNKDITLKYPDLSKYYENFRVDDDI